MDNNIYSRITTLGCLMIAWRKARKHKTKIQYVIEFEKDLEKNLLSLSSELIDKSYLPKPLVNFTLRDPKTRKISKSDFRDRIIHHDIVGAIENDFDKSFIYDSCANRMGKGNLFAIKRFDKFKRKVTKNFTREAFCLKADIKHYFEEVDHEILITLLRRKIIDEELIWLVRQILNNTPDASGGGANDVLSKKHATWQFDFSIFCQCLFK